MKRFLLVIIFLLIASVASAQDFTENCWHQTKITDVTLMTEAGKTTLTVRFPATHEQVRYKIKAIFADVNQIKRRTVTSPWFVASGEGQAIYFLDIEPELKQSDYYVEILLRQSPFIENIKK